ncbi:MAG: hypothetical protein H0V97_04700 [Actinobacteria bacterium]|nr:hypothetical protein [Actinomycetota bacterium]
MRSASYNLGALQAVEEGGVLKKADYLASVSGGGYIAGALQMVAASPDQSAVWGVHPKPFARLSPEELYLRNRSSYLAPTDSLKLKMAGRLLLGFLVNAAFMGSFLVILGRGLGYLAAYLRPALVHDGAVPRQRDLWDIWWARNLVYLACGLAALGFVLIMITVLRRLRVKLETALVRIGKLALGCAAVALIAVVVLPWGLHATRAALTSDVPIVDQPVGEIVVNVDEDSSDIVGSGSADQARAQREQQSKGASALTRLYAILAALGLPSVFGGAVMGFLKKDAAKLALFAARFVAPVLIAVGLVAAANDSAWAGAVSWTNDHWFPQFLWLIVPSAILMILYLWSDLTATSMHPFYKRRLATAFSLRRVSSGEPPPRDIDACERSYDDKVVLSETRPHPPDGSWPTLVCCAAANISDEARTAPGRNAVTFTFEPDRVGGPEVGYIPTRHYEQVLGKSRSEDITLPAAVAISGAALSPSMGHMTKRSLTFLLALVNARLGVWLPNPRLAAERHLREAVATASSEDPDAGDFEVKVWRRPKPRFTWLWREMRGRNSGDGRFLYVTDGGHWENLGLVELLRRGCTKIYCFDAAGDQEETFFTIGEAIALARSELGVEIDLKPELIRPNEGSKYSATDHVYGTFRYPDPSGREGSIVFAKAAVTEDAPWDVRAYKERDPAFPHHNLLAQMFADRTFESYRKLGYFTGCKAIATMANPPPAPVPGEEVSLEMTVGLFFPLDI